ncbi:MAG: hypothetical protein RBU37_25545 [Myxococcota bacterium]|jgi:hypothetical protein|nr:hypothetical protein [Myxococcota bacterium]
MTKLVPLPPCGLYRTTRAIGKAQAIPAAQLVMFHNHSEQGEPIALLPERNVNNRWQFASKGFLLDDAEEIASLEPLPREGFYVLKEHFHVDAKSVVAKGQLLQLGYNQRGEAIFFFPTQSQLANALEFPVQGLGVRAELLELLQAVDLRGVYVPEPAPAVV